MNKGFTLVELSIVLVIIGLLIGGILVGQSLIGSAKINRLVNDLRQYEVAVTQFKTKFKFYPGDAPSFTPPGAPNNHIDNGDTDGDRMPNAVFCNGNLSNAEKTQVWGHLSQAKMLTKNYASYSPSNCSGGPHDANYEDMKNAKIVWSTVELGSVTAAEWNRKENILMTGKEAAGNFYFSFFISPLETISLENKLGSNPLLGWAQVGMANGSGETAKCFTNDDGVYVNCSDPGAKFGYLFYFIPPQ